MAQCLDLLDTADSAAYLWDDERVLACYTRLVALWNAERNLEITEALLDDDVGRTYAMRPDRLLPERAPESPWYCQELDSR